MPGDVRKLVALGVTTFIIVVSFAVLGPRWLRAATGVENELITQLKQAERVGVDLEVAPYGTLHCALPQYQRLAVTVAADGEHATVMGTLDFTGNFELNTQVSSLGLERVPFRKVDGEWVPEQGLAPRLVAIVRALEGRRRALERGEVDRDAGISPELDRLLRLSKRSYRVDAWYIRSEHDSVEVSEDGRLTGDLPEKPLDERATHRLTLQALDSGAFMFAGGLL